MNTKKTHDINEINGAEICICIPARYNSSRLPGKLMKKIAGKEIIKRTYEAARKCKYSDCVYILVDDPILYEFCKIFANKFVLMTPIDCINGTERISKTLDKIPEQYRYIINIQADEPFIDPRNVDFAVEKHINIMNDTDPEIANIFYTTVHQKITDIKYLTDTSCVKVVFNKKNNVLYYTRTMVPCNKLNTPTLSHIYYMFTGIYVFNRTQLSKYWELSNAPLQLEEDIEQLKILEHGYVIKTFECPHYNEISINTQKDYDILNEKYKEDNEMNIH